MDFTVLNERAKERKKELKSEKEPIPRTSLLTPSTLLLFHRKNRRVLYYEYRWARIEWQKEMTKGRPNFYLPFPRIHLNFFPPLATYR